MPLTFIQHPGFGEGLNLRDQPDVVSPAQALDCLDVGFTAKGAVGQRAGYSKFTASAGTNRYDSLAPFYTSSGTKQLVAGAGNRLEGLDTGGNIVASTNAPTANPHYFARFGSPSVEEIFAANGTDALRVWNGAAWSTPVWTGTTPTGKFVTAYNISNRLVNARRSGTTLGDNPSTVRFSAAGDPTTWGANDFVDVLPGDGEPIMGICAWRELVFVFKQTKFFVFNGESQLVTGQPQFLYRPVSALHGLCAPNALAVSEEGVYFLDRTGIYRTTGGEPTLVSDPLDGLFNPLNIPPFYSGSQVNQGQIQVSAMTIVGNLLYIAVPTASSTNDRLLVYHRKQGWWSIYSIKASAITSFRPSQSGDLFFAYQTGTNDIGHHSSAAIKDDTTNIASFWRSGWWNHERLTTHVVRDLILSGSGSFRIGMAVDWGGEGQEQAFAFPSGRVWGDGTNTGDVWGDGSDPNNLWGGGTSVYEQTLRYAYRGQLFSLRFSGSGSPWQVHTLTYPLRETSIPYIHN